MCSSARWNYFNNTKALLAGRHSRQHQRVRGESVRSEVGLPTCESINFTNESWRLIETMSCTNLAVLADKLQQRVDHPLKEVDDELSMVVRQGCWQSVDP